VTYLSAIPVEPETEALLRRWIRSGLVLTDGLRVWTSVRGRLAGVDVAALERERS
jgi:hypothetical protein